MMNAEDILNSMKEQMADCHKKFDEINAQIEKLQEEYETKIQQALNRREQIRGEYTGIYNTYTKFTESPKSEDDTQEAEDKPKTESKKSDKPKSVKTSKSSSLTKEELSKISKTINKPENDDIPEYLKEEYNK